MQTALTAFIAAAARGDLETVRAMLEADPDLAVAAEQTGERAIHAAAYAGQVAVCEFLFAHGVEREFFLVTDLGLLDEVRALLDADPALVAARRPVGSIALHSAVFWGHPAVARLLLERGSDVTAVAKSGNTPLHSAVAAPAPYCPGDEEAVVLELVDLLLDAGADPNARNLGGLTPMFTAAANGDLRVVQRLIERGGDPSIAGFDNGGQYANRVPLDVAADRGHEHVVAFLRPRTAVRA